MQVGSIIEQNVFTPMVHAIYKRSNDCNWWIPTPRCEVLLLCKRVVYFFGNVIHYKLNSKVGAYAGQSMRIASNLARGRY